MNFGGVTPPFPPFTEQEEDTSVRRTQQVRRSMLEQSAQMDRRLNLLQQMERKSGVLRERRKSRQLTAVPREGRTLRDTVPDPDPVVDVAKTIKKMKEAITALKAHLANLIQFNMPAPTRQDIYHEMTGSIVELEKRLEELERAQ